MYICRGHYDMYVSVVTTIDLLTAEFGEVNWLDEG